MAEARHSDIVASNLLLKEECGVGGHVHVHVVPRTGAADVARDDQVFDELDAWVPLFGMSAPERAKVEVPPESARRSRTSDEMAAEAECYRRSSTSSSGLLASAHTFARFAIPQEHIFYESPSKLTCAFVNLRPLAVGHVLVTPRRIVPRICLLTDEEHDDLWSSVREVKVLVEKATGAAQSDLGVQDGREAGQSVPHVHVHVLPTAASKM